MSLPFLRFSRHHFCILRRAALSVLALFLCVIPPIWGAAPGAPVLRLILCGNTGGELFPCKVCGRAAEGGLARRSTLLDSLRGQAIPCLTLAGPTEFAPDRPDSKAPALFAAQTRAVYDLFQIDLGYASPAAGNWFRAEGQPLPIGFVQVGDTPVIRRCARGGLRVAAVFFPELTGTPTLDAGRMAAVLRAGEACRDADLVIGFSPWGFAAERARLAELNRDFDILLGGGTGFPVSSIIMDEAPGLVWVRPDATGRAVITLDILVPFAPGMERIWMESVHLDTRETLLSATIPENPAIRDRLAAARQEAHARGGLPASGTAAEMP